MPCVDVICLISLMIGFISQAWTFLTAQWLPYKITITTLRDPWPRLACAIFACVDLWLGGVRVGTLIWYGNLQYKMDKFLQPSPNSSSNQEWCCTNKEKEKRELRLAKQKQYDSTERKRGFVDSWSTDFPWLVLVTKKNPPLKKKTSKLK